MSETDKIAGKLDDVFRSIHANEMAGLPLLNPKIDVETLEFQEFEERIIGLVISPWLMSLIMLPSQQLGDDWESFEIGEQHTHAFPSGDYKFLVNHFEGIGVCQVHAIHSPMSNFFSHDHAKAVARQFIRKLLTVVDENDRLDEKRLERFINGEEMSDILSSEQVDEENIEAVAEQKPDPNAQIARRDFLAGNLGNKEQA